MNLFFYNIFLILYHAAIYIASLWNVKARLWVKGRKPFPHLERAQTAETIWMHCASLGEFEQGRPVIERIKNIYPQSRIVITFFSPSGYERIKNYKIADHIFYLPKDSKENAKKFIALIDPTLVLWIKYEYWFYYLNELKNKNIPALLISGIYRSDMPFFKWYGNLWRKTLQVFTHFFVQNNESKILLEKIISSKKITNSGDTRFDRVKNIAENYVAVPGIAEFCGTDRVIVAGSTWEDDEAELVHYVKAHPEIKFIIAPHEIDNGNLMDVKKQFSGSTFYSDYINQKSNTSKSDINCLIIDNIGMLSRLYKYADITYVGGGFGDDGLHNILEAAVYEKPVIFGPEYDKNFEAEEMIECGGGISVRNALELEKILNGLLTNKEKLNKRGKAAGNYVYSNAGATEKIIAFIQENRLLTN